MPDQPAIKASASQAPAAPIHINIRYSWQNFDWTIDIGLDSLETLKSRGDEIRNIVKALVSTPAADEYFKSVK